MIVFLDGVLEEKGPTRVVVNVNGVGYEAAIPSAAMTACRPRVRA